MKIRIIAIFAFVTLLFSCSSNDAGAGSTNYLSLKDANFWKYNVSLDGTASGQDHLYVGNDTLIGTATYKIMKTMAQPIGFFSNSLRNNGLRKDGTSIEISGKASIAGLPIPLDIVLNDFIIFKENGATNQELSSLSGTINQTIGTYPLTINYTMKSTSLESLPTFTTPAPDSKTYTDVKKVKTVMNMEVIASISGFPITVMNSQDVVISNQYYSKNIGMVYANTVTHYELTAAIPGTTIPTTNNQVQDEFLDSYSVQ